MSSYLMAQKSGKDHDATFMDPLWSESTVKFFKRVGMTGRTSSG